MSSRTARRRITRIRLPDAAAATTGPLPTSATAPICSRPRNRWDQGRRPGGHADHAHAGRRHRPRGGLPVQRRHHQGRHDLAEIRLCDGTTCGHAGHDGLGNIVDVRLAPPAAARPVPAAQLLVHQRLRCVREGEYRRASRSAKLEFERGPGHHLARQTGSRCRTCSGTPSGCSRARAGCTRPGCSGRMASCCACAKTSAGTTPSTRSWAGRCGRTAAAARVRAAGQRPRLVRAGAEGGAGRVPGARRRVRAVVAGGRAGRRRPA